MVNPGNLPPLDDYNGYADFWRYDIGVNIMPADTKKKAIYEKWSEWQDSSIPEEVHNKWKKEGTFSKGIAVILGKLWHNTLPKDRKNKIILIYAAKDYEEGKVRNKLRGSDIEKIVSASKNYKDIDRYCHIAEFDELKENQFNLNAPRYVDISEPEEEVDIQETIDNLKKLENERQELEVQVTANLKEVGFKV